MKGAALSAHLYWSSVALSGFSSGDLSSFSTLICKPGSGRFKGQTLLSSVRQKNKTTVSTSQSSKLHILDTMCLARYVDCVPQNKEDKKKDDKRLNVFVLVTVYLKNLMFITIKICFVEDFCERFLFFSTRNMSLLLY